MACACAAGSPPSGTGLSEGVSSACGVGSACCAAACGSAAAGCAAGGGFGGAESCGAAAAADDAVCHTATSSPSRHDVTSTCGEAAIGTECGRSPMRSPPPGASPCTGVAHAAAEGGARRESGETAGSARAARERRGSGEAGFGERDLGAGEACGIWWHSRRDTISPPSGAI